MASRKTPPPPQTAAQLQQSLAADLHSGVFANDSVQVQIEGQDIHLSGVVHSAEHKGLATRQARLLASKGGWTSFHVINQISVNLPPLQ